MRPRDSAAHDIFCGQVVGAVGVDPWAWDRRAASAREIGTAGPEPARARNVGKLSVTERKMLKIGLVRRCNACAQQGDKKPQSHPSTIHTLSILPSCSSSRRFA